ncbi:MAG: hypothetical protein DYG98_21740 [Haliscomenobacteraceae bacterium CHB4]|nr:hypothetical protein [Haliscomenobacteraceae bacterium CHB4]
MQLEDQPEGTEPETLTEETTEILVSEFDGEEPESEETDEEEVAEAIEEVEETQEQTEESEG